MFKILLAQRPSPRRGLSLATTLMVVAVLVALGLTVVAVSMQNLSVSLRIGNLERARQAAESAISVAIEKILADPAYGVSRDSSADINVSPRANDATGLVTFSSNHSDMVYSSNNLAGESPLPGYAGRAVPPHSAHLIGIGLSGGVCRRIETVVTIPPFPYAIACSGPFESSGSLYLAGVATPQDVTGSGQTVPSQKLLPAHLVSNGLGAQAVQLGPDTTISGDVRSAGGILLDPTNTQVMGEIARNGAPRSIPQLDVASLDPLLNVQTQVAALSLGTANAPAYQGFVRRQGDMTIDGGLVLDNGVLFVQGDLRITGGIRGVGAVIATGIVQVVGGSSLSSDDRLALVSGGSLSLRGAGADSSYFQGLIYSGGGFSADQITLVGSLIVQAGQARSTLNQAHLIHCPPLTRLQITPPPTVSLTFTSSVPTPGAPSATIQVGYQTSGFSVMDPADDTTSDDLTVVEAANEIESILTNEGMAGVAAQADIVTRLQALTQGPLPGSAAFSLDPSSFLRMQERIRIVLWEES